MSRGFFFAAAALAALSNATAASAMPVVAGLNASAGEPAATQVQFNPGYVETPLDLPAAVIGGALGVITSVLTPTTFGPYDPNFGPSWSDRMAACAANFMTFDPASGMYMTYYGYPVMCPFLR